MAVLICVALNGFHALVKYHWHRDNLELADDVYPVVYTEASGCYKCTVTGEDGSILATKEFEVKRKHTNALLQVPILFPILSLIL